MKYCPTWVCTVLALFGLHRVTPIFGEHVRLRQAIDQLHRELARKKNA